MEKTQDRGLETLQVWQRAMAFAVKVCRQVLPSLPSQEKWSLVNQLRRSVQSIPANIAEGYGRFYYQESIRFCLHSTWFAGRNFQSHNPCPLLDLFR